jgi:hypothetical protein
MGLKPKPKASLHTAEAIASRKRKAIEDMRKVAEKEIAPPVPQAATLKMGPEAHVAQPPPILISRLGSPSRVIGIDVETNDFSPNETTRGRIGRFGWYTLKEESVMESARIVEIGWALGPADASIPPTVKSYFVTPTGFQVSERISNWSGGRISHSVAQEKGQPLATVLRMLMTDVMAEYALGGRVVAHQLDLATANPNLVAQIGYRREAHRVYWPQT